MKSENVKEEKVWETQGYLIREALVREIIDAERWQTVVSCWQALLKVKIMIKEAQEEDKILTQSQMANSDESKG